MLFGLIFGANAATRDATLTNTTAYNYNYMYPYMNNNMRTNLNPGVTPSQNSNLIDTVVRTTPNTSGRRVVPRTARTAARAGTVSPTQSARIAAPTTSRRVVARRGNIRGNTQQNVIQNASDNRSYPTFSARSGTTPLSTPDTTTHVSSTRCLSDYTECMNRYCMRADTAYNRCYCSSKLAQIDATYQESITSLINQIVSMKSTNQWSDAEMDEYWMDTVGKYRGENSWTNLDNALDIDWASTESRVRGQTAFTTGHEYCVQHLRGCYYMAANMRDVYRSEIARDCAAYESYLQTIKNAADSIVGANQ